MFHTEFFTLMVYAQDYNAMSVMFHCLLSFVMIFLCYYFAVPAAYKASTSDFVSRTFVEL